MRDNKKRKRNIAFETIEELSKLYGIAFCYCIVIGSKILSMFPLRGAAFCVRNFFVLMMSPLWYSLLFLIPITITTISIIKHDFLPVCIIQNDSWKSLLWKQQKKLVFQSIWYTISFFSIVFFLTKGMRLENWNQMGSYFYQKTQRISEITTLEFFIILFILCLIRNYLIGDVILLSIWKKATPIYGVILLCCIICFEIVIVKFPIFLRLFTVDYIMWIEKNMRIQMVIGFFIYITIFSIGFQKMIKKKEWIRYERI